MKLVDRYIAKNVIGATAVVMLVLLGIESFMEFVGQLSLIGKGNYGLVQALTYVPLQLPADLYQLFPMAGFLGSLIGLGRLAQTSQLIVMRAAGVSIGQIVWSVVKAALMMIIAVTFIGEFIAPSLQIKADQLQAIALKHDRSFEALGGIWLRAQNTFMHIEKLKSADEIENIYRYHFDSKNNLQSASYASHGIYKQGHWYLYNITQSIISYKKVITHHFDKLPLGFNFKPKLLQQVKRKIGQESIFSLLRDVNYREQTGLVATQYELAFWSRLFQPLTTILMICLGIPFIFGSLRSASMGLKILTGIIMGFGFYMLNQFFGPITLVYQFPPILAASLPSLFFFILFIWLLRRVHPTS